MADGFENEKQSDYQDVYSHPSWKTETAKYEQELARRLYDQASVRAAGQQALSKISKLLIRYNRLKETDKKKKDYIAYEQFKENNYHQKMLEKLKAKESEIALIADEEVKKKRQEEFQQEKTKEESRHGEKMDAINGAGERMVKDDLVNNIENDRFGGILSSLMLGGRTAGARDYSLKSGSIQDLMTGKDYIDEISGEEGTLIDQMSLIDTAVNSGGIRMVEGDRKGIEGESMEGATYNLNDVLRNVTEEDQKRMNIGGIGGDTIDLNFEKIGEAQKQKKMDDLIGGPKARTTLEDSFNDRQVQSGMMLPQKEFGGKKRINPSEKELGTVKASSRMNRFTGSASVGSLFTIFSRRSHDGYVDEKGKFHRYKSHDERRQKLKEEATRDYAMYVQNLMQKKNRKKRLNQKDSSKNTLNNLKDFGGTDEMETTEKGFLTRTSSEEWLMADLKDQKKPENGQKNDQENIKEVELNIARNLGDKSARNIMAAYAMIEPDKKQQFLFRLALIAYMVPTGKKTLYDVLAESQEAGVTGEENLTEPALMYGNIYPLNEAQYKGILQGLPNPVDKVLQLKKENPGKKKEDLQLGFARYDEPIQTLTFTVKEGGMDKTYTVTDISPSLYEGYLQMFGSPEGAIKEMALYETQKKKISDLKNAGKKIPEELAHPTREDGIREEAKAFAAKHNNRLKKGEYNEEDMEYVFKTLPEREKAGEGGKLGGTLAENGLQPSSLLQAAVFKPIFEGVLKDPLPKEGNTEELGSVLSGRLAAMLEKPERKVKMKQFLSYHMKNLEGSGDEQAIFKSFCDLFCRSYIRNVIEATDPNYSSTAMALIFQKGGSFKDMILTLIREVKA